MLNPLCDASGWEGGKAPARPRSSLPTTLVRFARRTSPPFKYGQIGMFVPANTNAGVVAAVASAFDARLATDEFSPASVSEILLVAVRDQTPHPHLLKIIA